jgi:hypothetical protein
MRREKKTPSAATKPASGNKSLDEVQGKDTPFLRDSFVLYTSYFETFRRLSAADQATLLQIIFQYHIDGKIPEIKSRAVYAIWPIFQRQFDENNAKYERIVERNRNNSKNAGRKKNPKNPVD